MNKSNLKSTENKELTTVAGIIIDKAKVVETKIEESKPIRKTYVSFDDIKYSINVGTKTAVCIIKAKLHDEDFAHSNYYNFKLRKKAEAKFPEFSNKFFVVIGVAKCHHNDKFDETLGKRIAESKAKAEAFTRVYKYLDYFNALIIEDLSNDINISFNCEQAAITEKAHIKYLLDNHNK